MTDDTSIAHDASPEEIKPLLSRNDKGFLPATNNFLIILRHDAKFSRLCYDDLRAAPAKRIKPGLLDLWSDADDAGARTYVERVYGIRNVGKMADAFRVVVDQRHINPVAEWIEQTEWDGKPHVEGFFIKWLRAPDTKYGRECSRLFFAQGVRRTFEPGCKADAIIVLQGPQGCGKSTVSRWLALDDRYYAGLKTISGQRGIEAVRGKFVVEVEELLATVANGRNVNRDEESKAFFSTGSDYYRQPYDHFAADYPRHCVFIGTTNSAQFLTDPTGNRRWFPVRCGVTDAVELYRREQECREDIAQAWAEMLHAYRNGRPLAAPSENRDLIADIHVEQASAEVEDPRIGQIEQYCLEKMKRGKDRVCLIEVWEKCLHSGTSAKPEFTTAARRELGDLLRCKMGFVPSGSLTAHFGEYGRQKYFNIPAEHL